MARLSRIEGGERREALGPAFELTALGVALTLTIALIAGLPSWRHDLGRFQILYAIAFVFHGLAVLRLKSWGRLPHAGLAVFAVALATRAALLSVPAAPHSPALDPPLALAGLALVAAISPTALALKIWIVLHDLALVALLLLWSRRRDGTAAAALVYAWNPLVLVEFAGNGHLGPTAMVWWIAAFLLLERRPALSALAFATGALVQIFPLVSLPLLFVRWSTRARLAALAILAPGLAWFAFRIAPDLAKSFASERGGTAGGPIFEGLARLPGGRATAALAAVAMVAGVLAFALARRWRAERGTRLAVRAALLAAPVLAPWSLGWNLALEPLAPSAPWLLLSLTAILHYGVLVARPGAQEFHLGWGWRCLVYGLPLVLAIVLALVQRRRVKRPPALRLVEPETP